MNRLLLFLCCICVPWMARGQAAYDWYYWFDQGHASYVSGQSIGDRFTIEIDAQGLGDGFHTINMQVADTAGNYSPPYSRLFYQVKSRSVNVLHYWVDNDVENIYSIPFSTGVTTIDLSHVQSGIHFIYCQVEDATGTQSDVVARCFYRQKSHENMSWVYWFDEAEGLCQTVPYSGDVAMIDVSKLSDGFHTIHGQVSYPDLSETITRLFLKIPQVEGVDNMTCICTIDNKLVAQNVVTADGGIISWDMDVNALDVGIHKAMFQVITPSGAASSIAERYFVREITNKELGNMKCVYAIDNFETYSQAGTLSDGLFHFDLDVASLENGLHRIAYMLVSDEGVTTPQKTAFFWKTPMGGDGIVQYNYWVNDCDDQRHIVTLDQRKDPFSLITLLPVEMQPIRSSKFQFVIKNDAPLLYARNDFHVQFYDMSGRVAELTKEYVDEQVSAAVEPVGELQETQTFDKVAENDIRWYTMQVAPGDTAAFRVSQAATIQVFAPSGKEVFKTAESASVQWAGIHTWEEGTYYLAVHDVTGSQPTMTLDYMHMDKYDVVEWDVHTVGNGGCSTITFKGNGFRDLYAVDLYTAEGDTIHSVDVSHDSDAETAVTFDFSGAELSDYDAVFHFTEEEKVMSKVVTVEEAIDIELATNVTFSSIYLRGTSTTYTLKIKNKGNMMAYNVPIYLYVSALTYNGIKRIDLLGNGVKTLASSNYASRLSKEYIDTLRLAEKYLGLLSYLKYNRNISEDTNDSVSIWNGYIWQDIKPNEEVVVQVKIAASENVHAWFTVPEIWNTEHKEKVVKYAPRRMENSNSDPCIKAREECYATPPCFGGYVAMGLPVSGSGYVHAPKKRSYENVHCTWVYTRIPNCPPNPPNGGTSNAANSLDPNDIYGYLSDAGSKFIADSVAKVNYTIEFENDTAFAEASAHSIVIKDTLDSRYFDMRSFLPTSIKLGEREAFLDEADVKTEGGVTTFLTTIDVRPEINAIAQVEGTYNLTTGIAEWRFTSLDPMTMEPTDDLMQGILPVNYDGTSGIGEVMFEVGVKPNKGDGTQIPNRAGIVFDYEEAILTPTWVNTVDAVAPTSTILGGIQRTDSTLTLRLAGEDERSGVWKYNVYAQMGNGASWELVAENVQATAVAEGDDAEEGETETLVDVRIYDGIEYSFLVLATDSAGNVERKSFEEADFQLTTVMPGDANGDGTVDALDVVLATSYYLGNDVYLNFAAADVVEDGEINSLDVVAMQNIYLNATNGGKALVPRRRVRKLKR